MSAAVVDIAKSCPQQSAQKSPGVLVMGADYRGLGAIRSLGRQGVPVWVLKQGGQLLGAYSRYALRSISCNAANDAERISLLLGLAAHYGLHNWMLFPTDDESVGLVARNYDQLRAHYRLTTPRWDVLQWACDKRFLMQLAEQADVDRPWTFCPSSPEELTEFNCEFPVILKPAIREAFNRFTADKAWRVNTRQELIERYDEACSLLPQELIMVQEMVPGGGEAQYSYAALCHEGTPLAWLCARRTRQFPMDFGRASTYVETIEAPEIVAPSERLLKELRFTGLVEVEFKKDARDGRYKLLDMNPRVWGWHSLSARAGVDFPYLLWRTLNGESFPPQSGSAGVRWMRLSTDLQVALKEVFRGRLPLRDYLRSFQGPLEGAIFAADDPLPGLLEFPLLGYLFAKRLLRGRPI